MYLMNAAFLFAAVIFELKDDIALHQLLVLSSKKNPVLRGENRL